MADDVRDAKIPKEWDNLLFHNEEEMKLFPYNKMAVRLWGAVKELQKEITNLKEL